MIDDFLDRVGQALDAPSPRAAELLARLRTHLEEAERNGTLDAMLAALGTPEELAVKMVAGGHRHLDRVELPGGAAVRAASFDEAYVRSPAPDFGLYLDARWSPPWPHAHLDWPDFGVPADRAALVEALDDLLRRARRGEVVEVGCLGGHGRTGTVLAALAVLDGLTTDPVAWVRSAYCEQAVETDEQMALVRSLRGDSD